MTQTCRHCGVWLGPSEELRQWCSKECYDADTKDPVEEDAARKRRRWDREEQW